MAHKQMRLVRAAAYVGVGPTLSAVSGVNPGRPAGSSGDIDVREQVDTWLDEVLNGSKLRPQGNPMAFNSRLGIFLLSFSVTDTGTPVTTTSIVK